MAAAPSPLVVDIETVGVAWETLDPEVQRYLLCRARDEDEKEAVPDRLGLHPGTGKVVAIGLWRPEEDRGGVLVENSTSGMPSEGWIPFEGDNLIYYGSEREILEEFWRYVAQGAGTIVTFNGRCFDGPFLMLRSALLGVVPTRNLVPYRYSFREHCDLLEVLTLHRTVAPYSLDFWCRQFGIASPKREMDGGHVAEAYAAGEMAAIARYCLEDARATAELYRRLKPLIHLLDKPRP